MNLQFPKVQNMLHRLKYNWNSFLITTNRVQPHLCHCTLFILLLYFIGCFIPYLCNIYLFVLFPLLVKFKLNFVFPVPVHSVFQNHIPFLPTLSEVHLRFLHWFLMYYAAKQQRPDEFFLSAS